MERHYFGLSTLLASVALLIWSIGETFAFPQGPNVSMGSNPIVSFTCDSSPYIVPANMDLIITDVTSASDGGHSVLVDGSTLFYNYISGQVNRRHSFTTGYKVQSGSSVTCTGSQLYLSGYLSHQ